MKYYLMINDKNWKKPLLSDLERFMINSKDYDVPSNSKILKYSLFSSSFRAIFFYRLSQHKFFVKRKSFLQLLTIIASLLNEVVIYPTVQIKGGLFIGHPKCIVIHPKSRLGKNVTILQGVTIGGNIGKKRHGRLSPEIEDNVLIGAGAKVLGPIVIGENSMIGANAVVTKDVPKNSVVIGIPAKVIKTVTKPYIEIENEYYSKTG